MSFFVSAVSKVVLLFLCVSVVNARLSLSQLFSFLFNRIDAVALDQRDSARTE